MEEELVLWHLGPITLHAKTLVMTWIVMLAIIIFAFFATRKVTTGRPSGAQNVMEWVFEFIRNLISENMDWKKGASLLTYLVTLIMFIFFANMLGLVPNLTFGLLSNVEFLELNEIFHGPTFMSPTADVNTTLGLAILTLILFNAYGLFWQRGKYLKHFASPMAPIEIVELFTKPMTLGMRLFGNIFAGEILIKVILSMAAAATVTVGGAVMFAGSAVLNTVWLGFSVFVGVIQSFVFTVLTLAYVSQAVGSGEHH